MTASRRGWLVAAALVCAGAAVAGRADRPAVHYRVTMRGLAFVPEVVEAAPGDSVTWINSDLVPHTVTGAAGRWESGNLPPHARFTWVVDSTGTFAYHCRYHPDMSGSVVAR